MSSQHRGSEALVQSLLATIEREALRANSAEDQLERVDKVFLGRPWDWRGTGPFGCRVECMTELLRELDTRQKQMDVLAVENHKLSQLAGSRLRELQETRE